MGQAGRYHRVRVSGRLGSRCPLHLLTDGMLSPSDSTIYDPSLEVVEVLDLSPSGGVYRTTYGPKFFDVLKRLPDSTQFIACLNFGNDSLEIASAQAQAAVDSLGSQLYALECASYCRPVAVTGARADD